MADGLTAISSKPKSPAQFQGIFDVIPFKFTFEDDSILDGDEYALDAAVPGAALGDFVLVTPNADAADLIMVAYVTAADVVTVSLVNVTGGTLTTFATGIVCNGVILKPKGVFDSL